MRSGAVQRPRLQPALVFLGSVLVLVPGCNLVACRFDDLSPSSILIPCQPVVLLRI
jgi:hypothetical protein